MCKALVLVTPEFTKIFIVQCDASENGIELVLMQEGHPLSFTSNPIKGNNFKNPIYVKEMLAIRHTLKQLLFRKTHPYSIRHIRLPTY